MFGTKTNLKVTDDLKRFNAISEICQMKSFEYSQVMIHAQAIVKTIALV